jgi:hypothetical protein
VYLRDAGSTFGLLMDYIQSGAALRRPMVAVWFGLGYYGWPAWARIKEVGVRVYNNEAGVRDLQIAKDEAALAAEDFYEKNWPFQTDEIAAQYGELQFTAVIMLAEFEQFAQQGGTKRSR